ncbi:cold-shock protein [Sporobolomyces salmoneus]|uniref:cold-shock protein n=1 Tax=Sporobolomyces salmoneus TaxID=183962 RepID=UPI00318068D4
MSRSTDILPPGGIPGRRSNWVPPTSSIEQDNFFNSPPIASRGVAPPNPPSWMIPAPQALVHELAKFDNLTSYEELVYAMDQSPGESTPYPISSAPSSAASTPLRGRSRGRGIEDQSFASSEDFNNMSFVSEADSSFPRALDAMDPKLSPAARRYLNEYNEGQHRINTTSFPHPLSAWFAPPPFAPPPPPVQPQFYSSSSPPLSTMNEFSAALPPLHLFDPASSTTPNLNGFPFVPPPVQPLNSNSYFPGPVVMPIPPPLLSLPEGGGIVPPTFDFQLAPSPNSIPDLAARDSSSTSLSPSLSFGSSSSSSSSNGFSFISPSTTASTSPNPDGGYLKPLSFTGFDALLASSGGIRRKKKSLVRLCAEEHAKRCGSVRSWGICKFFDGNKGWGFILDQSRVPGEDVWTHYTNLEIPRGHRFLVSEEVVEYLIAWDSKKSQLKALLVTGLGGTPLLASSDPTLAASLTKFKPSQGPLPSDLSPESKQRIYAIKRDKQRDLDEQVKKERIKRLMQKELAQRGGLQVKGQIVPPPPTTTTTTGTDPATTEEEEEEVGIKRGLLNFGVIGMNPGNAQDGAGGLIGLGLGIGEIEEDGLTTDDEGEIEIESVGEEEVDTE